MIIIDQVSKQYNKNTVVDNLSLEIGKGELFGLIGHNGAGKTTLFKMILGLLKPTQGNISFNDISIHNKQFIDIKKQIGYLPENISFYENLTGLETLNFYAKLKQLDIKQAGALLDKVGLANVGKKRIKEYSKGMKQRLGFAQALLGKPNFLFLDEPTNGLDPRGVKDFYEILFSLVEEGVTIIITSHVLAEIQERVSKLAILRNGHLTAVGTLQELRNQVGLNIRVKIDKKDLGHLAIENMAIDYISQAIQEQGNELILTIPKQLKMSFLADLSQYFEQINNLEIIEPSLEDVFLDYDNKENP